MLQWVDFFGFILINKHYSFYFPHIIFGGEDPSKPRMCDSVRHQKVSTTVIEAWFIRDKRKKMLNKLTVTGDKWQWRVTLTGGRWRWQRQVKVTGD